MELVSRKNAVYENYLMRSVKIKNEDVELNGAYYVPEGVHANLAAVVIVHGSAPDTYEDVAFYTRLATKLRMAVLAFDKRGAGESSGKYQQFTVEGSIDWFALLASDVVAWTQWIKGQPEIDKSKIGLLGGSQAGWIMPLAAAQDTAIRFIISGEGVSVSAGEENFFSQLTYDGGPNGMAIQKADEKLKNFEGPFGFDPRYVLSKLDANMLWFFGTEDPVIPVDASLRELKKINNDHFKVVILPHGNHNFRNVQTGERYDLAPYIKPWLERLGIL